MLLLAIQGGDLEGARLALGVVPDLRAITPSAFYRTRRSGRRPSLRPQGLQVAEPMRERNNAITTRAPARRLVSKRPLPSSSLEPQWDLKLDDIDD